MWTLIGSWRVVRLPLSLSHTHSHTGKYSSHHITPHAYGPAAITRWVIQTMSLLINAFLALTQSTSFISHKRVQGQLETGGVTMRVAQSTPSWIPCILYCAIGKAKHVHPGLYRTQHALQCSIKILWKTFTVEYINTYRRQNHHPYALAASLCTSTGSLKTWHVSELRWQRIIHRLLQRFDKNVGKVPASG